MRFSQTKQFKSICFLLIFSFLTNSLTYAAPLDLPNPQEFISLSSVYSFPVLKGLKFDPANPLKMEFIVDTADKKDISQEEAGLLIKYFLAGLTTPEKDIWVNLSPYEGDRIIPEGLSQTDLGKDLLSQDYLLKQLTSSLTYPESDTGKDYWEKTYAEVMKIAKTTKLPVNTFNKVWIVPDEAEVYETDNAGLITKAKLKVMLEEDYLALKNKQESPDFQKESRKYKMGEELVADVNQAASKVMKETILPKINQEVNSGKNFARLRQIYYSLILGLWFKQKFQDSIYQHYINQGKTKGIDLEDKTVKEKVYQHYCEAFKTGLYNYIRTDQEPATHKKIKRRYYSGGFDLPEGFAVAIKKEAPFWNGSLAGDGAFSGSPYSEPIKNGKRLEVKFEDSSQRAEDGFPLSKAAAGANSPLVSPPLSQKGENRYSPEGQWEKWSGASVSEEDLKLYNDMFRDYDYRHTGLTRLKPEMVFRLGLVWADMAIKKAEEVGIGDRRVLVAKDARKIEPELEDALIAALRYRGLDVIYMAKDTPNAVTSYSWGIQQYKPLMGIFITASHVSEPEEVMVRGFKVAMLKEKDGNIQSMTTHEIKTESLEAIKDLIQNPGKIKSLESPQKGKLIPVNIDENVVRINTLIGKVVAALDGSLYKLGQILKEAKEPLTVLSDLEKQYSSKELPLVGMKIVIEGFSTPSGKLAAATFKNLGAEVTLIHGDIQEISGRHKADPSIEANLEELKKEIKEKEAHLGLAFDLDGDRGAIIVPERSSEDTSKIQFHNLAPDNLMVALLPSLVSDWGYGSQKDKKIGVIKDVLGTYGIYDIAKELGIEAYQTDAGYVFLKEKKEEMEKGGYVFPIYGERSGHTWTGVSGEIENPLAVAILFATLVKREQASLETINPVLEVYNKKTIPYLQSPRFQPFFHPNLLSRLSGDPRNQTGWRYNPENPTRPPQAIIALGRNLAVELLKEEFTPGKTYPTLAGDLTVKEVKLYPESRKPGELYRFADIVFEINRRFAGHFVLRASANDPSFVSAYEAKQWPGQTIERTQEIKSSIARVVLSFLTSKGLAIVTRKAMEKSFPHLSHEEREKQFNKANLGPVEKDFNEFLKASSAISLKLISPLNSALASKTLDQKMFEFTKSKVFESEERLVKVGMEWDLEAFGQALLYGDGASRHGKPMQETLEKLDEFYQRHFAGGTQDFKSDVEIAGIGIGGQMDVTNAIVGTIRYYNNRNASLLASLGKDYNAIEERWIKFLREGNDPRLFWIVGSKSGTTPETMINFQETTKTMIRVWARKLFRDEFGKVMADKLINKLYDGKPLYEKKLSALNLSDEEKKVLKNVFGTLIVVTGSEESGSLLAKLINRSFINELYEQGEEKVVIIDLPANLGGRKQSIGPNAAAYARGLRVDSLKMQKASRELAQEIMEYQEKGLMHPSKELAIKLFLSQAKQFIIVHPNDSIFKNITGALEQIIPESLGKGRDIGFPVGMQTYSFNKDDINKSAFVKDMKGEGRVYFVIDVMGQKPIELAKEIQENNWVIRYTLNEVSEGELSKLFQFVEEVTMRYGFLNLAQALLRALEDKISPVHREEVTLEGIDLRKVISGPQDSDHQYELYKELHEIYLDFSPDRQPKVEEAKKITKDEAKKLFNLNLKQPVFDENGLPIRDETKRGDFYTEKNSALTNGAILDKDSLGLTNGQGEYVTDNTAKEELDKQMAALKITPRQGDLDKDGIRKLLDKLEKLQEEMSRSGVPLNSFADVDKLVRQERELFAEIKNLASGGRLTGTLEETARQMAALVIKAHHEGKSLDFVLYEDRTPLLEAVTRFNRYLGIDKSNHGTIEQHKSFELSAGGVDVSFMLLINSVKTLDNLKEKQRPIIYDGLVGKEIAGLYPSEVNGLNLEAYIKEFKKVKTGVAALRVKDVTAKENLIELILLFTRTMEIVHQTTSSSAIAALSQDKVVKAMREAGKLVLTMEDGTEVYRISSVEGLPEEVKKYWDGHEALYILENPTIGYTAYAAVHAYFGDPQRAIGGTRVIPYKSVEEMIADLLNLSKAMSMKDALAGLDDIAGGAKVGINEAELFIGITSEQAREEKKQAALDNLALTLQELNVGIITSTDSGTTSKNIDRMADVAPKVIAGVPGKGLGGAHTSPATATGVFNGIKAAVEFASENIADFGSSELKGKIISLQGLGGVGNILLGKLLEAGATVYATDKKSEIRKQIKEKYLKYLNSQLFILGVPEGIFNVRADIFSPNGIGGVLDEKTIPLLKKAGVKIIAGAANNQLKETVEDSLRLHEEGILYVPDYVINAGGVIAALAGIGGYSLNEKIEGIGKTVKDILEEALKQKVSPAVVADVRARKIIAEKRRSERVEKYNRIMAIEEREERKETERKAAATVAKDVFNLWRRSYNRRPPPDEKGLSESSEDVHKKRILPFNKEILTPSIQKGHNLLISAHGNSLRTFSMELFGLTADEIKDFTFPLATLLRIRFDADRKVTSVLIVESSKRESPDSKNVQALTEVLRKKGIQVKSVKLPTDKEETKTLIKEGVTGMGELFLIRHGQTVSSDTLPGGGYFAGQLDVELTEQGKEDAREAGRVLKELFSITNIKINAAYTSDLKRAQNTLNEVLSAAGISISDVVPVTIDPRLKERHYGALQGKKREEFMKELSRIIQKLWKENPELRRATPDKIAQELSEKWQELSVASSALLSATPEKTTLSPYSSNRGGIDLEDIAERTNIKSGPASSPLPSIETQGFPSVPVNFPNWPGLFFKIVRIEDIENLEKMFTAPLYAKAESP